MTLPLATPPRFPVLIGDVGGTNARFEIIVDRFATPRAFEIAKVADHETIEAAIEATVLDRTSDMPASMILAAAGPIDDDGLDLTNSHWFIRPDAMIERLGVADVILLNDFEAQAFALTALHDDDYLELGGGVREAGRNRVVLGPGTGLGVAGLVHAAGTWVPVPGEGGHVDLGPRDAAEAQVFEHLEKIGGRVSAEQVLSGRGIRNVYQAIEKATGREGALRNESCEPAAITSAAMDGSDALSVETMDFFCTQLGRVAGDLALIYLAYGGVHLGGGIARKIAPFLERSAFRAAFEDKAPHSDLLGQIGTAIVMHDLPALRGLASFACTPDAYSIDMNGRRWSAPQPAAGVAAGVASGTAAS